MTSIKLTYPKGTKVKFTDPADKGPIATVLGPGDKDFDLYGVEAFDYLVKQGDLPDDDMFAVRRVFSHEIVSI